MKPSFGTWYHQNALVLRYSAQLHDPSKFPDRWRELCRDSPISCPATAVYVLAVNARGPFHCRATHLILRTAIEVDVFEIKSMDVAWKVSMDDQ